MAVTWDTLVMVVCGGGGVGSLDQSMVGWLRLGGFGSLDAAVTLVDWRASSRFELGLVAQAHVVGCW